jgi:hypothetical protein
MACCCGKGTVGAFVEIRRVTDVLEDPVVESLQKFVVSQKF